ncbi:MAG: glycerol-3-phosphate 1-O-acyltransferase PlsY [Planctomycetota bacterium]
MPLLVMTPVQSASSLIVLSYLLGAVPFSLLIGFLAGVDIRKVGSGNIGATNLKRALADRRGGRWIALFGYILDITKGLAAVKGLAPLAVSLLPVGDYDYHILFQTLAGSAAIIGHIFPVWLKFKGGKGVATFFGIMIGLSPIALPVCAIAYLVVTRVSKYVSVGSMTAAILFPVVQITYLSVYTETGALDPENSLPLTVFSIFVALIVIARHSANIKRLLRGEENKIRTG